MVASAVQPGRMLCYTRSSPCSQSASRSLLIQYQLASWPALTVKAGSVAGGSTPAELEWVCAVDVWAPALVTVAAALVPVGDGGLGRATSVMPGARHTAIAGFATTERRQTDLGVRPGTGARRRLMRTSTEVLRGNRLSSSSMRGWEGDLLPTSLGWRSPRRDRPAMVLGLPGGPEHRIPNKTGGRGGRDTSTSINGVTVLERKIRERVSLHQWRSSMRIERRALGHRP
jgi:hypothetical protein